MLGEWLSKTHTVQPHYHLEVEVRIGPGTGLALKALGAPGIPQPLGIEVSQTFTNPCHRAPVVCERSHCSMRDPGPRSQKQHPQDGDGNEGLPDLIVDGNSSSLLLNERVFHIEIGKPVPELWQLFKVSNTADGWHEGSYGLRDRSPKPSAFPGPIPRSIVLTARSRSRTSRTPSKSTAWT